MDDTYRTLQEPAEGGYRDKGSRFIACGFPVMHENEVRSILAGIRKKYHDASHHCYAYRLGHRNEVYRINDDGEPSGTAGRPIYGQILSNNLTNILVVVVRYFGGVLLGTRGLINAYRSATSDMLSRARVVDRVAEGKLKVVFPYEALNPVMKILKEEAAVPETPIYTEMCSMYLKVRESSLNRLVGRLQVIPGLACESVQIND
jgi:uncharacterized YigZ family protein